jgi:glycosyltransferase involved in cell wall biosynthesis
VASATTGAQTKASYSTVSRFKRWFFSFESLYCGLKLWMLISLVPLMRQLRAVRYDVVINSCPPMSTALVTFFAKKLARQKFRWVIDLRDPFTTPSGPSNTSRLRSTLERWAERTCLGGCDLILVSTPALAQSIAERLPSIGSKIEVVFNGYDGDALTSRPMPSQPAAKRTVHLLSAGTIYFRRDPRPLLDAMVLAIDRDRLPNDAFHLTVLGNCENPTAEQLREMIADRNLSHAVDVKAAVPPSEVDSYIDRAHVLVNFAQGQHMLIPAKTYEYMASGRETLTITELDSQTAGVVNRTASGPIALPNAESLSEALTSLYRRYIEHGESFSPNTSAIYEFSRSHQNERTLSLILDRVNAPTSQQGHQKALSDSNPSRTALDSRDR